MFGALLGSNVMTTLPAASRLKVTTVSQVKTVQREKDAVLILWADGHRSEYDMIWLRHNCRCQTCRDPGTDQNLIFVPDIPESLSPKKVELSGGNLHLEWQDGHQTVFSDTWLRTYCYSSEERAKRHRRPFLWDSGIATKLPSVDYRQARTESAARLDLLRKVAHFGFALLENVPNEHDEVERIGPLLGSIEPTVYGRIEDVKSVPNPKLFGNSSRPLTIHVDMPYVYSPPDIGIFHCLANANNGEGESILVDGFRLAEQLRQEDPASFDLLTLVPQKYERIHKSESHWECEAPIIQLNYWGEFVAFRYADRTVAPLDVPRALIRPFYKAFRHLAEISRRPEFEARFQLQTGQGLIYDNHRILHGRAGFNGYRHIRQAFVSRDSFHSNLRVLEKLSASRASTLS